VGDWSWACTAAAVAAAPFVPGLRGEFVYDDHRFFADNANLGRVSILWRAFADPSCQTSDGTDAGLWRPLRTLSFALDRALFGDGALGPHAVNLVLHATGAALVFLLLRRIGGGALAAFLGSLVFAFHPAQVECVAWVSSRGDLIAFALVAAAIVLDLSGRGRVAIALGAAALLAKEQAVVWPALAWIASRLAGRSTLDATKRAAVPACLVVAFVLVRQVLLAEPTQQGGLGGGPVRIAELSSMLGHQAWFAAVPVGSLFDWQMFGPGSPHACPWPVAIASAVAVAAAVWRPTRLAALWFLAALVPTLFLQAFVPLNILVADRFLLFALPALAIATARAVDRFGPVPAIAAALAFGTIAELQIPVWRDEASLWTPTADRVPGHARANHWLGIVHLKRGESEEAVRRLRAAVASDPAGAKTRFDLASALEVRGRRTKDPAMLVEACSEYAKAVVLYDDPRAEGRAESQPLARVAAVDCAVLGGVDEFGAEKVKALLASTRPPVPDAAKFNWDLRIESLARSAGGNPLLGPAIADRVREWGALP
jgi:hypothetical protein